MPKLLAAEWKWKNATVVNVAMNFVISPPSDDGKNSLQAENAALATTTLLHSQKGAVLQVN